MGTAPLHVRWLGTVRYRDALALQHGLLRHGTADHLLLLEHPHVYTLGVRADLAHLLVRPAEVGAELVRADRGGDITYHGPGQLVGYPILTLPGKGAGDKPDTAAYVHGLEQVVIDTLADLGLTGAQRLDGYPGVWVGSGVDARKICAIGVRISRGRTMHGFALNVDPDMAMFDHIVPCGIADKSVTSLQMEGIRVSMREVVDALVRRAAGVWAEGRGIVRHDVAWRHRRSDLAPFSRGEGPGAPVRSGGAPLIEAAAGNSAQTRARLSDAGVTEGLTISTRKPPYAKAKLRITPEYVRLKRTMRDLQLVTVCEEAGCPNIYECWADGTATFMLSGDRCTRACGFCLVDTRKPAPLDPTEPQRVAAAVERMQLAYAVLTCVARDDLPDGGAAHMAATVGAIRARTPQVKVETLISDCKGDPDSLRVIFDARPDVLNHNVETVPRLQRAVRPSASYARSLAVLARAKEFGLVTKSSLMVGIGETDDEVLATLADLRAVGVDIVTIGQYLRPTTHHLPVTRWVDPQQFEAFAKAGEAMGIGHVEASPLTRSSYHARQAAAGALPADAALSGA